MGHAESKALRNHDDPSDRHLGPELVTLSDEHATDGRLTGSKAAALAVASVAGVSTLPGVVLTTAFTATIDADPAQSGEHPAIRTLPSIWPAAASSPLVARSSSVVEDTAGSSMAGQFDSVIGITGFDAVRRRRATVLDSAARPAPPEPDRRARPAVDRARVGGVLFGVDPVTGAHRPTGGVRGRRRARAARERRGRRLAVRARRPGQVIETDRGDGPELSAPTCAPAGRAVEAGGPCLRRPPGRRVGHRHRRSPLAAADPSGHHRDPGRPVGPDLRTGSGGRDLPRAAHRARARSLGAAAARRGPRGRAARRHGHADGGRAPATSSCRSAATSPSTSASPARSPRSASLLQRLNPVPAARRLRGAWRVGRLRAALPALAEEPRSTGSTPISRRCRRSTS